MTPITKTKLHIGSGCQVPTSRRQKCQNFNLAYLSASSPFSHLFCVKTTTTHPNALQICQSVADTIVISITNLTRHHILPHYKKFHPRNLYHTSRRTLKQVGLQHQSLWLPSGLALLVIASHYFYIGNGPVAQFFHLSTKNSQWSYLISQVLTVRK